MIRPLSAIDRTRTQSKEGGLVPRTAKPADGAALWANYLEKESKSGLAGVAVILAGNAELERWDFSYGSGLAKKANVKKPPPPNGEGRRILDLTVVMSVSGHTGQADAFAKSNTYTIKVTRPDGGIHWMRNIPRKSAIEYATVQNVSFPLDEGVTVLEAWADGSAGAGGYLEGRRYEIHFQKQPYRPSWTWGDDEKLRPFVEPRIPY